MQDFSKHIDPLRKSIKGLYAKQRREVPFHGWHHVSFVAINARGFAEELGADMAIAEIAALVHDVNYLIDARSDASAGVSLRRDILTSAGLNDESVKLIETVVVSAETQWRDADISKEAMALSDADTLFKALPITPVVLAPLYMRETGRSVRELAEKIVGEQVPLRDNGIYFYSESAKKRFERWADANLSLWSCILESLEYPSVIELIDQVVKYTKINGE